MDTVAGLNEDPIGTPGRNFPGSAAGTSPARAAVLTAIAKSSSTRGAARPRTV